MQEHKIPIGTLVEVKFDEWLTGGACYKIHARLWVVEHTRDCDLTPLYSISRWKNPESAKRFGGVHHGFCEDSMEVVEITEELERGVDALTWEQREREGEG